MFPTNNFAGFIIKMANVHINNLDVGTLYEINHRVHEGAPKYGQFLELVDPSPGFVNRRAKFAMVGPLVPPGATRSFQPENWIFTVAAAPAQQQQAGRRRKTRRASHKKRQSTRRRRAH